MQPSGLPFNTLGIDSAIDRHPLTVAPDTPLVEVLGLMSKLRSSCIIPVCSSVTNPLEASLSSTSGGGLLDRENEKVLDAAHSAGGCVLVMDGLQLVGVFTERDMVRLTAAGASLAAVKILDVVTQPPLVLKHSEVKDVFTVLSLFRQHRIRHLPIVDDGGSLVGVVTQDSIRTALQPVNLLTRLRYVRDVMTPSVVHAPLTASVMDLAQLMARQLVSCVVITKEARGNCTESSNSQFATSTLQLPVGIVTERDIVQFQALELDLSKTQAKDVMSTPLFCLSPSDSLWVAHQEMQRRRVRRLVVSGSGGELLGIVSQTSLLQVLNPADMYGVIEVLQQAVEERTQTLNNTNERLRREISERKRAEEALRQAHDDLKKQVEERTAQLTRANALLKQDIIERQRVEAALRQSEAQSKEQTTKLEQTVQELQKTQAQLIEKEKMSTLGQMVSAVTQEINNPINFIYGNLTYAGQYVEDLLLLLQVYAKNYPQPADEVQEEIDTIDLDFIKKDLPKILGSMQLGADRIRNLLLYLRNFSRVEDIHKITSANVKQRVENKAIKNSHYLNF
ncbi:CBS domain-containing protein [Microcoleus sp. FACHB-831]|uniref:CBS domain-containing protein n=1 Tax=Microcoleus sp. FACHB-831 TaxID=2692827 RepID=UPI0016840251|nr:CBS domain-containing protein [Microcoleus sp. FACHB-831]MBD1923196.1 CBS domain-containing protein [Microcoleus sp. FACHB-831]